MDRAVGRPRLIPSVFLFISLLYSYCCTLDLWFVVPFSGLLRVTDLFGEESPTTGIRAFEGDNFLVLKVVFFGTTVRFYHGI